MTEEEFLTAIDDDTTQLTYATTIPELAKIIVHNREIQIAEKKLNEAVHAAREAGITWQEIGEALEMTRQGAHHKFSVRDAA